MEMKRQGRCVYCIHRSDFVHYCNHCRHNYPDQYEFDKEYCEEKMFGKSKQDQTCN